MDTINTRQTTLEGGPVEYLMEYQGKEYLCTQLSKTKWAALGAEFKTLKAIKLAILELPDEPKVESVGTFDCVDPNALLLLLFTGHKLDNLEEEIHRTLSANSWKGPDDAELDVESAIRIYNKTRKTHD